jgi:hypothetical protein
MTGMWFVNDEPSRRVAQATDRASVAGAKRGRRFARWTPYVVVRVDWSVAAMVFFLKAVFPGCFT